MNFYIGNSIGKIDKQDVNVEFSDKLINFIYKLRGKGKIYCTLKDSPRGIRIQCAISNYF